MSTAPVHVVLPGDVADPAAPSGGNAYDRRICAGLPACGRPVDEHPVPGRWPRPDAAARDRLHRLLAALPDNAAVLLDGLVACGVPEVLLPHARRLRTVVLVHLPLADETGQDPAVAADLDARERRVLHAARAVLVTSRWAAHRLAERHGLPPDLPHVVPPGTDPASPATGTDGASRLICVASVTHRKGHDVLLRALAAVADLPFRCDCAGPLDRDPAFTDRIRALIAHHGLGDRVHLLGPRTGDALAATVDAADLTVLASRAETYGMALTESLARGTPVLATDVGGVPDAVGTVPRPTGPDVGGAGMASGVVPGAPSAPAAPMTGPGLGGVPDGPASGSPLFATRVGGVPAIGAPEASGRMPGLLVPGLLVPPDDPAALAAALRRWLTDPALRDRLRVAARARRRTLGDWTAAVRSVAAVLTEVEAA